MCHSQPTARGREAREPDCGFTLIELLVVIVIIGILVTMAIPSFKGLGQGNSMAVAKRQLMDDIHLARTMAIQQRTEVAVIFMDTQNFVGMEQNFLRNQNQFRADHPGWHILTNCVAGQYRGYVLYARYRLDERSQRKVDGRFVTDLKYLPDGILIPPRNFDRGTRDSVDEYHRGLYFFEVAYSVHEPTYVSWRTIFPSIAFDAQGQLMDAGLNGRRVTPPRDQILSLAYGSVFFTESPDAFYDLDVPVEVRITPPDNYTNHFLRVNWLTGKVTQEGPRPR